MNGETFDVGDLVRLSAAFADLNGTAVDPTTVRFRIKAPDGTVTSYLYGTDAQLMRDGVGAYHVDWPVAANGTHWWRFESTGAGQAAEESSFTARASRVS